MKLLSLGVCLATLVNSILSQPAQNFDYFTYAEQWPAAFCAVANYNRPGTCAYNNTITTGWTIHGLWPDVYQGNFPSDCHVGDFTFDPTKVTSLYGQLEGQWPNLIVGEPLWDFWKHEWEKHGTCAESVPMFAGELNYFSQALMINKAQNTAGKLAAAGFVPSNTTMYTLTQLKTALKTFIPFNVETECVYNQNTDTNYLAGIRVCIDKTKKYMDCPSQQVQSVRNLPNPQQCRDENTFLYLPL